MTSKKDDVKIQGKKMFKIGDILKVKEDYREFVNEPLYLYKVIEIKQNPYSGDVIRYVIRSINNRKIRLDLYHKFVDSAFEEVQNFCTM